MKLLIGLLTLVGHVRAQELTYFQSPVPLWTQPAGVYPVGDGNGVFLSPDQRTLMVTSADGTITALNATSGSTIYTYKPAMNGAYPVFCTSGISFGISRDIGEFAVYAVSDGFAGADPSYWYVSRDFHGIEFHILSRLTLISLLSPLCYERSNFC